MDVRPQNELVIAVICERMHWTYEEYINAPQWLIDTLLIKWMVEGKKAKDNEQHR